MIARALRARARRGGTGGGRAGQHRSRSSTSPATATRPTRTAASTPGSASRRPFPRSTGARLAIAESEDPRPRAEAPHRARGAQARRRRGCGRGGRGRRAAGRAARPAARRDRGGGRRRSGDRDDLILFNIRHPDDALRAERCAATSSTPSPAGRCSPTPWRSSWRRAAGARCCSSPGPIRRAWPTPRPSRRRRRSSASTIVETRPFELTNDPRRRELTNVALLTGGRRLRRRLRRRRDGRVRPLRPLRDLLAAAGGRQRRPQGAGLALEPRALRRPAAQPALRPAAPTATCRRRLGRLGRRPQPWSRRSPRPAAPTCATSAPSSRPTHFTLDLYKGLPGSYRPWDGQLRQQIILADSDATHRDAPLPQFLHESNVLDTLGSRPPGGRLSKARRSLSSWTTLPAVFQYHPLNP